MDGECAFCGRADAASNQLFCEDCQAHHRVCQRCAEEVTSEAQQTYRLVA
jgi:hypothetical protein